MASYLYEKYPDSPPVPLYCAGRFCQMKNIERFASCNPKSSFADILQSLQSAHTSVAGGVEPGTWARHVPALIGLCIMDGAVRNWVGTYTEESPNPDLEKVLRSFRLKTDSDDFRFVQRIVAADDFKAGMDLIWGPLSDNEPWAEGVPTLEQTIWWPGHSEYAIP